MRQRKKRLMRDLVNFSIRFNKKMQDANRMVFNIHPGDKMPTHHIPSASQPNTVIENTSNHFEHQVWALKHETGDASKPEHIYEVRTLGRRVGRS
jgi:hypothetical protein